ncbi:MAG TPA: S-layer homology domain-containing protein [Oscillospiraceae bacterium]|nr:S-layer homology domain-containing protein [Oscillospiraceae bacterium]
MKKRALSILLCLCMVASLFSVVTIPAMAANDTIVNATIGGDTTTIYQYAKGSGTLSSNKNYRVVWCGTSPSEINGQLVFSTYTTMASFSYEYKSIAPWGPKWYSTFYPDDEKEVSGYGNMANIEGSKQEPRFAADGYTILLSDYAADSTSENKDDLNYWYDAGNQYRSTSGYHTTSNLYFVSEGSKVEYTLDHISENGVGIDSTKQKAGTTISKSDLTNLTNTQAIYKDSSSNTLTYNAKTDDIGFYIQNPAYPASTLNKTLSGGTNTLYLTFGGKSVQASTLSLPMDTAVTVKKNGAAWTDSAPAVTLQSGTEEAISATTVANGVSTFTNLDPAKTYKVLSGETDTGKTVKVDSTTATLDYYTLSVTDGEHMTGAYLGTGGTTSGVYLSGTQVTISSGTAATGYSFDSWALSGKTVGSDSTIAGSQVTANGNGTFTSQAKLAAPTVAVTGKNGAGTPALSTTYEDTVTLTATPSHALGDGVTYTYQWYKGGTDEANKLTGKTAQTLTLSQHDDSGDYYCNVTATNKDSTPLSASATSAKATVTISPKPVAFAVSGTSQTYQPGTARSITITDTGTKNLTASDFTVKYYKVDEDNGLLTGTTPVANAISIGRYLYVIGFKADQPGYKITIPFAVNDTTLPTIANYDNVGYLDIKAGTEQQQPISFASGAVSKYVADGTFKNALTNPNGTAATFQSSDTSVAAVAPDGTVTIKAAGSTTITAASSKDGTSPVYASYTLTVTKETVTVTVRDKKIQYSDAMPYTDITALSFSKSISIDAADYAATDLTFSGYTKGRGTGEYTIIAKGLSSDKYSFTYEAGTLTVDPKPLTASDFTVSVANKEYDGTTSASFTIAVNAVTGDVLTAVCTGAFDSENAADSVTATCTITGVAGSKADNYTLSSAVVKTAAARISPMPITFTFGTTTYLYDGQQKPVIISAVDSSNRVFSDFTVKYGEDTDPPSTVGTYAVTAELSDGANYTTSSNTTALTITEGSAVVWASAGTSQKYDGSPKSITAMSVPTVPTAVSYYAITDEGLVGETVDTPTAVGRYLYVIAQTDTNYRIKNAAAVNIGDTVASLTGSNCGIMEILENIQPTLSFSDPLVNAAYGGAAFTETPAGGADGATITYQSSDTDIVNVNSSSGEVTVVKPGLATITATANKDGFGDVTATYAVQVGKKAVTLSIDAETSVTYKGENWIIPYQLTGYLDGNKLGVLDITFTYTDQSDPNKHTPKNAGTYLAIAQVKADNEFYTSGQATGLLKITPAQLTVTADDKTITYGDIAPTYTVRYTPLGEDVLGCLNGTTVFNCTYQQFGDHGTYPITPSGLSSENYTITFQAGTLTAKPKTVTLNWSADSLPYSGAAQAVTATVSGLVNGDAAKVTAYTGNTQTDVSTAYTATATMLDNANYTRTGSTNVTHNWSITAVAPSMALSSQILPNTGSPIAIGAAKVTGVGNDGNITERYTVTYTYYTDAARQTQTTAADGAVTDGGAPSENGTYYVTAEIASQGNYTAAAATATLTLYTPLPGGGTGSGSSPTSAGAPVIVDGKTQNIGTEKIAGDTTTVTVDQSKLGTNISGAAFGSSVVVPVSKNLSATASLAVKNIQDMAARRMTLTVQTGSVAYNLNTSAIDTAALASAFPGADMSKVPFDVTITNSSVRIEGKTPVLSPVAFTVTATYNGKTVSVDTFSAYVDRVIEVTAEQAAKITTAVVVNADGSTRHVPTNVIEKNGKYYAVINSRTNSTYALIQNKVTFADAEGKWYEATVNEMGSRKIIEGRSASAFDGAAGITRAEFAAILVRALGLPADGTSTFSDVPAHAWYTGAVATAVQYGLTEGKGNGRFDPSAAITRQEAMLMLQRAAALTEFTGARGDLDSFTDANSVGSWALDAAKWSVGSGLIQGTDGKLNAAANITRAESATIILRLLQKAGLVDVRSEA